MNEALRAELLAMREADLSLRERLLKTGILNEGYHPEMEALHLKNAVRLDELLRRLGRFPGRSDAGEDGAEAAWIVLVHAVSLPSLMRAAIPLLEAAVEAGELSPARLAAVVDRVLFHEGKPQRYGLVFDWNDEGELDCGPVEDGADERRAAIGLPPLAEAVKAQREAALRAGEKPPTDWKAKREEAERWAARAGWR